ncbi:TIGR04283 family arsenosugar biosynthesis glycosyltransferase [soil metagenome]
MQISIIIPTFNEEDSIGILIRELQMRADGEIPEIIVSDGGSTDQTKDMVNISGATFISCSGSGRALQMNQGAEEAAGEIFYFLHADTVPPDGYDQLIKQALSDGAGAGCFQLMFSGNHPVLRFYGWCTRFKSTFLRYGDQSLFVKRELFQKVRGYDENLSVMEDQEMVRKLKKISSFVLLDQAVKTSARKYEINGVFKLQLIYLSIFGLYYFGARQETLIHLYRSLIKTD